MKSWLAPAIVTVFLYGLWSFLPKLSVKYLSPSSAVLYEVLGSMIFGAIAIAMMGFQVQFHPRGALFAIATGFCLVLAGLTYLIAASRGPVALVSTVSSLYPVVTLVLASLLLGETITLRQGCGIALAIISVVLMAG
jgi:bacterial/archaeal transporter family protein